VGIPGYNIFIIPYILCLLVDLFIVLTVLTVLGTITIILQNKLLYTLYYISLFV